MRSVTCVLTSHNRLAVCTMRHNWKIRKGHSRDKLRQEIIQLFPGAKKQKGRLTIMTKTVIYLTLWGNALNFSRRWELTANRQRGWPFTGQSITGGKNDLSEGKSITFLNGQILCWSYDLHKKKWKILLTPVTSSAKKKNQTRNNHNLVWVIAVLTDSEFHP